MVEPKQDPGANRGQLEQQIEEAVKVSSSKPPRPDARPRRTISGTLTLSPEILKMKEEQEKAKQSAERILKKISTPPPPSIPDDR